MTIREFDWTDEIVLKIEAKHNVRPREVEEAALAEPHIRRGREGLYLLFGRTNAGRYLFVVFRHLGRGCIRPITARDMTREERRLYEGSI